MIAQLSLAILLTQTGYVRSRVDSDDPMSQCLWWPENTAIVLHQNNAGNPENNGTEFAAFGKAVTAWQTQLNSCSSLTIADGTRTDSRQTGLFDDQDNQNVILFRQTKCTDSVAPTDACWKEENDDCGTKYDCWQHQAAAIAITTTSYNPKTGRILDSDIEFNTPSFVFTTVDSPPCPSVELVSQSCVASDIQNTATHELGHLLGLSHIGQAMSTMAPSAKLGETSKRLLDSGTARFVCEVYPAGKPSRTCVLKTVEPTLGKSSGCSSAPVAFVGLALATLLRRRRRT
ncbi:MAG: matrixin [Archangium gephyra]|uniref:Matrixin n=1 Tax=Archangium gephyra TaxID=48 RepID=A0A2W5TRM1_9BACT|nr:MAG: matrixin [Archangium gephyra]